MKTIELSGVKRTLGLKGDKKRMRKGGNTPCIVYGNGEPEMIAIDTKALKKALYTPETYIVNLDVDGAKSSAVIRESQFHPVTDQLLHVDFLRISDTEPIELEIPISLVGAAKGVIEGGKLMKMLRKLKVRGIPSKLPESIEIDITDLGLGKTVKVSEINVEGIEVTNSPQSAVAAVEIPRALRGGAAGEEEEGDEEAAE